VDQDLVDEIGRGLRIPEGDPASVDDVPGRFEQADQCLFEWILKGRAGVPDPTPET
jgi:hypothetical protein